MNFRAGVASSTLLDTELSGKTIATEALSRADIKHADFAFIIISDSHDYDIFLKAVKSVLGNKTIIAGGSSIGIITNETLVYEEKQTGVWHYLYSYTKRSRSYLQSPKKAKD